MVKNSFKGSGGPAQMGDSSSVGGRDAPPPTLNAAPPSLSMSPPSGVMPMQSSSASSLSLTPPTGVMPLANIGSSPANPAIHGTLEAPDMGGVSASSYGMGQGLVDSAYGPQMTNGASNAYPGLAGLGGGGVLKAQTGTNVPKLGQV